MPYDPTKLQLRLSREATTMIHGLAGGNPVLMHEMIEQAIMRYCAEELSRRTSYEKICVGDCWRSIPCHKQPCWLKGASR